MPGRPFPKPFPDTCDSTFLPGVMKDSCSGSVDLAVVFCVVVGFSIALLASAIGLETLRFIRGTTGAIEELEALIDEASNNIFPPIPFCGRKEVKLL